MITDNMLIQVAKAIEGTSYDVPSYTAIGTDTAMTEIQSTTEQLSGEIGTRMSSSILRSGNQVEYSAIRSGASVIDTANGDDLTSFGVFSDATQSTSDLLLTGVAIAGTLHTTAYDIEFITQLEVERK